MWYSWTPEFDGTAAFGLTAGYNYLDIFVGDTVERLSRVGGISFPMWIPTGGSPPANAISVSAGTNYKLRVVQVNDFFVNAGFTFTLINTPVALAQYSVRPPTPSRSATLFIPSNRSSFIETSTNLVDWELWRTNVVGPTNFMIVPNSREPQRFFRLRMPE